MPRGICSQPLEQHRRLNAAIRRPAEWSIACALTTLSSPRYGFGFVDGSHKVGRKFDRVCKPRRSYRATSLVDAAVRWR